MRHTESETQRFCVKWFRLQYPQLAKLLFAVPNGGARNLTEAAIMKGEGVTAGVSDMILMYPTGQYHGLCIEFKTAKGKQTQAQKEWQEIIEMRELQKQYLRTRSPETSRQSRRLEKEIDDEIKRVQEIIHRQNNPTLW